MAMHVTNGDSAAGTLRDTGLSGEVLAWRDTLHEGPVRAVPRAELLHERARFLAECGHGDVLAELEERDRKLVDALAGDVVLWFEHDLYDQLQLLDVLALAHEHGAAPEAIVVDSFLGTLSADELEALWPLRRPTAPAVAARAWAAFREPEPAALVEWATRESPELPFLAPAFRRLLEELPSPVDGLSGTERRALQAIAAGARTPGDAFVAAQRLEDAPFLGDTWFYRALAALGELVEHEPLRLSATGERVLRGEADRVELLGIDRWVGGTHVTPESLWRWDGSTLRHESRRRP